MGAHRPSAAVRISPHVYPSPACNTPAPSVMRPCTVGNSVPDGMDIAQFPLPSTGMAQALAELDLSERELPTRKAGSVFTSGGLV